MRDPVTPVHAQISAYLFITGEHGGVWAWAQEINGGDGWLIAPRSPALHRAERTARVRLSDDALQRICWLALFGAVPKPDWYEGDGEMGALA